VENYVDGPEITFAATQAGGSTTLLEDQVINLDLTTQVTSLQGDESIQSIRLSGLPAGSVLSAGTEESPGIWVLQEGDLPNLQLTLPQDFNGQIDLQVEATAQQLNSEFTFEERIFEDLNTYNIENSSWNYFGIDVSGVVGSIENVTATTWIDHPMNQDLFMRLDAPEGFTQLLSSYEGGTRSDGFYGTTWGDAAAESVLDYDFTQGSATELSPEGSFDVWEGYDPNGTWELEIYDYYANKSGDLEGWNLGITTGLENELQYVRNDATLDSPGITISDTQWDIYTTTIEVSDPGFTPEFFEVYTDISHTWTEDMEIRVTAPDGQSFVLTYGSGGDLANVLTGTWWTNFSENDTYGADFQDGVAIADLQPERDLVLADPTSAVGTWTLEVSDWWDLDGGSINEWGIRFVDQAEYRTSTTTENITLDIQGINDAPEWTGNLHTLETYANVQFSVVLDGNLFSDNDGDHLDWSVQFNGSTLPGVAFDPSTRTLSGTMDETMLGANTLTVTATDPSGDNASVDLDWNHQTPPDARMVNYTGALIGTNADDNLEPDGHDAVFGLDGNDVINMTGSLDYFGGDGDDTFGGLTSAGANSTIDGGDGSDTLQLKAPGGLVEVNLMDGIVGGTAHIAGTTLTGIENLNAGSPHSQYSFFGDANDNILIGGNKDDILSGGPGGADTLIGGGGNDTLYIQSDESTVDAGTGDDMIHISSETTASIDGGEGNDTLVFNQSDAVIDFSNLTNVTNIDTVQASDTVAQTLQIDGSDILRMSDSSSLFVDGDADDTVQVPDTFGLSGTQDQAGYTRYEDSDTGTALYVDDEVTVTDPFGFGV